MITVRQAADADVPALAELRRASALELRPRSEAEGHEGYEGYEGYEERFASWYLRESSRRLTWLAEADGHPVGMVNLAVFERMPRPGDDPGLWGYLANAYVRPACRNRGIGTLLIEEVLRYADSRGFARVVLSPSERSIPFYRRAGFGRADALLLRERPAGRA